MVKRILLILTITLLLTATAQPEETVETRLALLEERLARVERDLGLLNGVPAQLARIEAQIVLLMGRTDATQNSVVQFVLQPAFTIAIGLGVGLLLRRKDAS